jgi:hypothetical protein
MAGELPKGWEIYAANHPHATIYHTVVWQQILQETYPYRFFGIYAVDGSDSVIGILPVYLVSSSLTGRRLSTAPFSFICDPIADNDRIIENLVDAALRLCQENKAAYYELKCLRTCSAAAQRFQLSKQFETYRLDLHPTEEQIWAGTHKGIIQRGVNKAQKEGVEIRIGEDQGCIEVFHHLNLLTCRKHGIPAQPLRFHREVWTNLAAKGKADFLFAYYRNEAIAAVVIFYHRDTAIYMYGASDERYLAQRPNHLLLWHAILRAKQKGMTIFDLGRVSDDNPGLKEFKQRWGADTVALHYYYWPEKKGVGSVNRKSLKFRLITLMFSKLPLFLTSRLTWLYKHLA